MYKCGNLMLHFPNMYKCIIIYIYEKSISEIVLYIFQRAQNKTLSMYFQEKYAAIVLELEKLCGRPTCMVPNILRCLPLSPLTLLFIFLLRRQTLECKGGRSDRPTTAPICSAVAGRTGESSAGQPVADYSRRAPAGAHTAR